MKKKPISAVLNDLRRQFIQQLPGRLSAIRTHFDDLDRQAWEPTIAEELHRMLHGLTGSAGTFDMKPLSDASRQLESTMSALIKSGETPLANDWQTFAADLDSLEKLAHITMDSSAPNLEPPPVQPRYRSPLIFLVEDDPVQGEVLSHSLIDEGYRVRVFTEADAFRRACNEIESERPAAVIMDMIFPEGDELGAALIAELGLGKDNDIPVVVASVRDDLIGRLAAFRAGASRYLSKPVEPARLINLLDALTGRQPAQPYRVLLVDDDPLLLEAQAQVLREVGMEVRALSQPLLTLDAVDDFMPDVVILDVYMPEASGPELAAVLRERDAQLHLPILFLSAETDMGQQLLALNLGGDDFLVKPVRPEHLVAAVTARARRARQNLSIRQRLETTLYEREREHLAVDQHALVSIADRAGNITYANRLFCEVSGYSHEELIGENHRIIKSGAHPPEFYQDIWSTISHGEVWQGDICNRRKDGSLYWVESTITPFVDSNGVPYQYVSIRTDITHLRNTQQALEDSKENLQATLESTQDGILAVNAEGTISFVNQRFIHMWGIPEDLMREGNDEKLVKHVEHQLVNPAVFRSKIQNLYQSMDESLDILEFIDGRAYERYSKPILKHKMNDGRVWSFRDITERVRAEQALLSSEEHHRLTITCADLGTWDWDMTTDHVDFNERWAEMRGYKLADLKPHADTWRMNIHPDDMPVLGELLTTHIAGRSNLFEAEYRVMTRAGKWIWILDRGSVIARNAEGAPLRMAGTEMDISDRKQAEQNMLIAHDEAERANKAKSEFLSNMSHELRTPMNAILGFGQLMEYEESLSKENKEYISEILKAGHHLLELINEVLDLSKIESGHFDFILEPVELCPVIEECLQLCDGLTKKYDIQLGHSGLNDAVVQADRKRLKQVMLNLLSNAIKYNRVGGSVNLQVHHQGNNILRICVTDTGVGISSDDMSHLFQPFNRLNAEHSGIEGTGIGLSISKRIIEMMGGTVEVQSVLGVGSTFCITLPLDILPETDDGHNKVIINSVPQLQINDEGRQFTVLYIEDNLSNLKLVARVLGTRKHIRLHTAMTPEEGIELANSCNPDLTLLDINMPGMNGYQVLEIFKSDAILKDVPVIATTANAMPGDIADGMQAGFTDYLTKPLNIRKFLDTIDHHLLSKTARDE